MSQNIQRANANAAGRAQVPRQAVVHQAEEHKRNRERNTDPRKLKVDRGNVVVYQNNYKFSPEQLGSLYMYFENLSWGRSDQGDRLKVGGEYGYVAHHHALGATYRALFDDLITYKYSDNLEMLDIGTSTVRMLSRFESNGDPVWFRTFCMKPNMGSRDDKRTSDNRHRIASMVADLNTKHKVAMPENRGVAPNDHVSLHADYHTCKHAAGPVKELHVFQTLQQFLDASPDNTEDMYQLPTQLIAENARYEGRGTCHVCRPERVYPIIKSIDSAYYDGVIEEILKRCAKHDSTGYVVLNDYCSSVHNALTKKQVIVDAQGKIVVTGDAALNHWQKPESSFVVTADLGKPAMVSVKVEGNTMNYRHKIFRTTDDYSFHYRFVGEDFQSYIATFEKLEEAQNGDTPYRMFRITASRETNWNRDDLENTAILNFEDCWLDYECLAANYAVIAETFEQNALDRYNLQQAKEESIRIAAEEKKKKLQKPVKPTSAQANTVEETKTAVSTPKEKEIDLRHFNEDLYKHKNLKKGDWKFNQLTNAGTRDRDGSFIRMVRSMFDKSIFNTRLRMVGDKTYFVVTPMEKNWLGMSRPIKEFTAMAEVGAVYDAYHAIGVKESMKAIQSACVALQRDKVKEGGQAGANLNDMENFTIARILRATEFQRSKRIMALTVEQAFPGAN